MTTIPKTLQVIPDSDIADRDAIVICGGPQHSHFADDTHATCAECSAPIVHRPHLPKTARKVCIRCGYNLMRAAEETGEPVTHAVTKTTADEVRLLASKARGSA